MEHTEHCKKRMKWGDGECDCKHGVSASFSNELLCWTKEPPSEVGYFWLKNGLSNALIVDVFNHDGAYRFMVDKNCYPGVSVDVVSSDALWAGPILKPTT